MSRRWKSFKRVAWVAKICNQNVANKTPITKIAHPSMGTLRMTIKQHTRTQHVIIKHSFSTAAEFPVQSSHQTAFPHFRNEEGSCFDVFCPYRRLSPTMPNNT